MFTLGQGLHGGYECKTKNTEHAWAVEMSPGLPTQRRRGEREDLVMDIGCHYVTQCHIQSYTVMSL